jgi:hypothetical protein
LRFLVAMQDGTTGGLPNYGPNDGTLLLPLSACPYADYRPALSGLSVILGEGPPYGPGPWDEEAAWLAGPAGREGLRRTPRAAADGGPDRAPVLPYEEAPPRAFPTGGYYRLDGPGTHGIIRCGVYKHRPHQADMLHLDVWVHGHNVLGDPGTCAYNAERRWVEYFAGAASHNTVTVDGRDPMRRGARFLWHDWVHGHVINWTPAGEGGLFRGFHDGYQPVRHTRTIELGDGLWRVIDDLEGGEREHEFRLHWLLPMAAVTPDDCGAQIRLPRGRVPVLRLECRAQPTGWSDWSRGDVRIPRGWIARHYGDRSPAWSYAVTVRGTRVRFLTLLGREEAVRRNRDAPKLIES